MRGHAQASRRKVYDARKAIIVHSGKILLLKLNAEGLQLGYNPSLGTWDIPGGRMKPGENETDTLKRESKEEAGIEISVGKELNSFEFSPRPDVIIRAKNFLCSTISPKVILNDPENQHNGYEWVPLEEALEYDIPEWLREGIELVRQDI